MQTLKADHLTALSDGFLLPVTRRPQGPAVLIQGRYNLARFSPALFDRLGIVRPDSLARAIDKRLAEVLAGRCMARIAQDAPQVRVNPGDKLDHGNGLIIWS